jgi:hypothetical protein
MNHRRPNEPRDCFVQEIEHTIYAVHVRDVQLVVVDADVSNVDALLERQLGLVEVIQWHGRLPAKHGRRMRAARVACEPSECPEQFRLRDAELLPCNCGR